MIDIKKAFQRGLCILLTLVMPLSMAGNATQGAVPADENCMPIEEPVEDNLFDRVMAFFLYAYAETSDLFGGLFTKIKGESVVKYHDITLDVGADEPFTFIHISDTHLSRANLNDGRAKLELANKRAKDFPDSVKMLNEIQEKSDELDCFVVHSGDMIDFVSEENLKLAKEFTDNVDCIMAAGNHEFSPTVFDDPASPPELRDYFLERVQTSFKNDICFYSRTVNGVNLVALDNGSHKVEQWQVTKLKEEIDKGLPIILILHVPLYTPEEYEFAISQFGQSAWLMNVPEDKLALYTEEDRLSQEADAPTKEAYKLIVNSPNIMAILCGHQHYNHTSMVTPTLPQYVIDCTTADIVTVN